jgi:DNA polymerase III alpha subunit (gram-positive type)
VIFADGVEDGWDLPPRKCACGSEMIGDGHDIPFETYRYVVHSYTSFEVAVSSSFLERATAIINEYFKDCDLKIDERVPGGIVTFNIATKGKVVPVTLSVDKNLTLFKKLERAASITFDQIPFTCEGIIEEFGKCNVDGIPEYKADIVKNMIRKVSPRSFHELIQISGLAHGCSTWIENGEFLIENGHTVGELIAYREDVFNCVHKKMLSKGLDDTGFAYKIMTDVRKGLYAKNGISDFDRSHLEMIGVEDWFIDSIGKIYYLFPKSNGTAIVKLSAILRWYKLHFPVEFGKIMLQL